MRTRWQPPKACALWLRAIWRKRHELAGVHQLVRIEGTLDRAQRRHARRRGQAFELAQLHLADAVLGGDRSARGDDQVVDHAGRRLADFFAPALGIGAVGRVDVEMDVAVAEMPERRAMHAWK